MPGAKISESAKTKHGLQTMQVCCMSVGLSVYSGWRKQGWGEGGGRRRRAEGRRVQLQLGDSDHTVKTVGHQRPEERMSDRPQISDSMQVCLSICYLVSVKLYWASAVCQWKCEK